MPIYKVKRSKDEKQKYKVPVNYQDSIRESTVDRVNYDNSEAKELERELNY